MGRTIMPMRFEVDAQLEELRRFITSLRKEDQIHFNKLVTSAKTHIPSITYANPLNPNELMQWSALLELEKKLNHLKHEIDRRFYK